MFYAGEASRRARSRRSSTGPAPYTQALLRVASGGDFQRRELRVIPGPAAAGGRRRSRLPVRTALPGRHRRVPVRLGRPGPRWAPGTRSAASGPAIRAGAAADAELAAR